MLRKINVSAFVDWKSQLHNAAQLNEQRMDRKVAATLAFIVDKINKALISEVAADRYDVSVRLYYGWHRGLTPVPARTEMERLRAEGQLPASLGRSAFDWRCPFSDTLVSALDRRLHPRINIHLPCSLRDDQNHPGEEHEKMVDTALASDLLCSARMERDNVRLVMAEDDDVIPAVFTAEQWTQPKGGRCMILRKRKASAHLQLSGLLVSLGDSS